MDSHADVKPDENHGCGSGDSEEGNYPLAFNQDFLDVLLSESPEEEFETRMSKLSEGDYNRERALFTAGGGLDSDNCGSGLFTTMDAAICYTELAVKELQPREELKNFATLYADLLKQKAEKSLELGDLERYISGVQLCIEHLEECACKEKMQRHLGCAYYNRAAISTDPRDLDIAIQCLEGCFGTPDETYPQEAICLGAGLHHRYQRDKQLQDLDRSVELLRRGLGAVPRNKPQYDCLTDAGLHYLASACAMVDDCPCSNEMLGRVIHNVEVVVSSTPPDNNPEVIGRIQKLCLQLTMKQSLAESDSVRKLRDTIMTHLVDETLHSLTPTVRREVPHTMMGLFMNEPFSNKTSIRLVKLLPGKAEDFVLCEMSEVGLDSLPHYEALSYVWGDPEETEKIGINSGIQEVTKNLHSALVRLRHPQRERTLWIDALCITQTNLDEKRHQIALMRTIYKKANTVIMWLGEPEIQESPVRLVSEGSRSVVIEVPSSRTMGTLISEAPIEDKSPRTHVFTKEKIPAVFEKIEWLRPFLQGSQATAPVSEEGAPGFSNLVYDMIQDIQWREFCQLLFHNIRFRRLPGRQLDIFDWTSPENLPSFYKAPQTRTMWPVLGAFTLIHCFSHYRHFWDLPFFGTADIDLTYFSGVMWRQSVGELVKILTSPYWERAWVLQEVVLAQNPVVYYGPHIMAFTELLKAAWAFGIHYGGCCSKWGEKAYRKEHTYWTKLFHAFRKFESLDELRYAHGTPSVLAAFSSRSVSNSADNRAKKSKDYFSSLSAILRMGIRNRQATDPRDLIYGILALVGGETGLEADYTLSVAEVFTQAAMRIISQQQSLAVLVYNLLGRNTQNSLPSWVPDWTSHARHFSNEYPINLYRVFLGHETQPCYAELEGGRTLHVRGVKIDTVSKVTARRIAGVYHPRELVRLLEEWRRDAGLDSPGPSDQDFQGKCGQDHWGGDESGDLEEKFWRSVFEDAMCEYDDLEHQETDTQQERERNTIRRFELRDVAKVSKWWSWLRSKTTSLVGLGFEWNSLRTLSHPEGFDALTDRFWDATESRKLMFTERARMGTGPSQNWEDVEYGDVQAGDEVYLLFGMALPVVLRRINNEQESSAGTTSRRHTFVGPCYLHGVMDGEAAVPAGSMAVEEVYLT